MFNWGFTPWHLRRAPPAAPSSSPACQMLGYTEAVVAASPNSWEIPGGEGAFKLGNSLGAGSGGLQCPCNAASARRCYLSSLAGVR